MAAVLAMAMSASMTTHAQTFFTQPQSHLGRLVQSITSPLVFSAAAGYGADSSSLDSGPPFDSGDSLAPASSGYTSQPQHQSENSHYQNYRAQQQQPQGASRYQQQALQQAPSQQRGFPQHYSNADIDADDEGYRPAEAPNGGRHFHAHHQQQQQQPRGAEQSASGAHKEYQMGAYLGPTIDDKEIQGAFNSNNDDRDEDDGPAGYVGSPTGRQQATHDNAAHSLSYFGPPSASSSRAAGHMSQGPRHSDGGASFNEDSPDSSAADEDGEEIGADQPAGRHGGGRNALNQAASQYHKQQQQPRARMQQQLATAANGFVPYGPIDLNGLMAVANGGQQGGYEVYNGDGSYAGPVNGFGGFNGPQQGRAHSRRQQAASMSNQFGYGNGPASYGANQHHGAGDANGNGDDDNEADADED